MAREEYRKDQGPLGPLPISGALVRQFLRTAGCSATRATTLLARAGIEPALLDDPAWRLSERQFKRFLLALSRQSRDEFWGLASRPVPLGTFQTFCRLIVNCRTLGQAVSIGSRFYRLVINDFAVKMRSEDGITTIWLKVDPPGVDVARHVHMQAAALFVLYQLMCWLVGRRLPLDAVHFAFNRGPNSAEPLRAYETATVAFEQDQTAIRLKEHLLALPILADEKGLSRFLSDGPRGMVVRYHDASRIDDKVRAILKRNLGSAMDLDDVATLLRLTPVTLRRRLADEGLTFSDMRDDVRRSAALELVRQGEKLENVATRLGFSEYSTFHRAFRRWTGVAPTEFRQAEGADDVPSDASGKRHAQ